MKTIFKMLPLFLACVLLISADALIAKGKDGSQSVLASRSAVTQNTTNRTLVNVGQVAMWIHSDGHTSQKPDGASGLFFPRGSNPSTATIFQDQLVWGGQVIDGAEPIVRVGGGQYVVGNVPGKILSQGVPEDRTDTNINRVWRVRRDFLTANLTQDAAEFNDVLAGAVTGAQTDQLRDIYRQDWIDWPADRGAPFYDADGDGQYSPAFNGDGSPKLAPVGAEEFDAAVHADEPGIAGADQIVWLVTNDLGPSLANFSGSPSIGIEQQITAWAYARADELGQIVFKQFRFIYKGNVNTIPIARIDSMYVAQWSDPDLGNAGDDLAGSDTDLSLGYAYNSNAVDAVYASVGLPPAASGYDFFAGPLVDSVGAEGIFGLEKVTDRVNLPMSFFGSFSAGSQASDPDLGTYDNTLQWYNMMRRFLPRPVTPLTPFTDPDGNAALTTLDGDPVTNTGWVDAGQGDRRLFLVSGPFSMALGDTNEVVVAALSAIGTDRLSSVSVLKFVDRFAQEAFDNLFEIPKAPAAPVASATELDGEIFINWAGNASGVALTEGHNNLGHVFEGYNVYQLPSAAAGKSQSIRLATFDLINDITTISAEAFDIGSGQVLNLPSQFGNNTGINRTFTAGADLTRGLDLVNGQTYFFGVSAYSFNNTPGATTTTLESPITVLTVVPQSTKPGVRFQAVAGDTIPSVHDGASDGAVTVLVTDASALTGDSYEVTFGVDTTSIDLSDPDHPVVTTAPIWSLKNTTTGEMLIPKGSNQSGDADYLVTEGFTAVVTGAPNSFKDFQMISNGAGALDPIEAAAPDFRNFPVTGPRPSDANQVGSGHWFFNVGGGANDGTFATFLSRSLRGDNFSRVIPFDYEMRFTSRGSWALRWFEDDALVKVPFELWNIGSNTIDDPSDDYRLIPYFLSNGGVGAPQTDPLGLTYQLDPNDSGASGGNDDPHTPWIYWAAPDDTSPGEVGYNVYLTQIDTTVAPGTLGNVSFAGGAENFARTILVNWNGDDVSDGVVDPATQQHPEVGSVIRIISTKPNNASDTFTFSTTGFEPSSSVALAKEDVLALVNVFPNPYLAFNTFEGNRFNRQVRFSHLPADATIRIFNLGGVLVRTLVKSDASQFANWDLQNEDGLPVASGLYIANVEMPGLGSKNLKLAIVQEQQFLRRF